MNDAGLSYLMTCPIIAAANNCTAYLPLLTPPVLDDFSAPDPVPATLAYNQFTYGGYTGPTLVGGVYLYPAGPTPDADASTDGGYATGQWLVAKAGMVGTATTMHIEGPLQKAAGWGFYIQIGAVPSPGPACAIDAGVSVPVGGGIDASPYAGVSIRQQGYAGPTGMVTLELDSLSVPGDPFRMQTVYYRVPVPPTMTVFNIKWGDYSSIPCGKYDYFEPARLIGIKVIFDLAPGPTYYLNYDVDYFAFIPKAGADAGTDAGH
jgi:hypothetical protein